MKQVLLIVVVILILSAGISGFLFARHLTSKTPDTTAVVKEIRSLNRWETASYTVEKIIDQGTGGNVFQRFFFGNRILLIAHGEVVGGFDLSTVSEDAISIKGAYISIKLPEPQILYTRIDNSKTTVYDRQQGILVPSDNNLETDALSSAQKSIQDAAYSDGILSQAASNAKSQLNSLFSSLGFTSIEIIIPSGHC